MLKCKHGRNIDDFCCGCEYGDITKGYAYTKRPYDLVDELNMNIGYKLIRGFNLLRRK